LQLLVTFYSVSSALRLEAAGKEHDLFCALIPVPRKLSSSCGYAAEVEMGEPEALVELLRELNVEWDAVYRPCGKDYQMIHQAD
jgi:hypothetical protein